MKLNDVFTIENLLDEARGSLGMIYENFDTSEDAEWSEDLNKALELVESLKESMIFCFTYEDDEKEEPDK